MSITLEEYRRLLYAHGEAKVRQARALDDKDAPKWKSEEAAAEAYDAEKKLWEKINSGR